jgi:hypothetical protein
MIGTRGTPIAALLMLGSESRDFVYASGNRIV